MIQFFQWLVIYVENELLSSKAYIKNFHFPQSSSFQKERWVIFLMVFELSCCQWNGIEISIFVHLCQDAPSPPGVSAVPFEASVMSAYCQSNLGKAISGSEVSCFWSIRKAHFASSDKGPDIYPESFWVSFRVGLQSVQSPWCVFWRSGTTLWRIWWFWCMWVVWHPWQPYACSCLILFLLASVWNPDRKLLCCRICTSPG